MKKSLVAALLLGTAAVGTAGVACKPSRASVMRTDTSNGGDSVARAPDLDPTAVVATIDGKPITGKEIDGAIAPQLAQLGKKFQTDEFELRKQAIDEMLITRLVAAEAKKEGISDEAWVKKHVEEAATPPSEADAKAFFDENTARMGGRTFEQEKPDIMAFLTNQKRQQAAGKIFESLKSKAKINVLLEEPTTKVEAVGPSMGPQNAPVTIVEFSDFQCPFCSKVEPTIKRVMTDYAGKVRFVFRDYPLSFHEHAQKASEASHCAEAQQKYWPMHDAMFANQDKLDVDGLKKLAASVNGMDQTKFNACLDSGEMKDKVASNTKAGEAAGVAGTPHFFVNGHSLDGAQPYEAFKSTIDRELAKSAPTK